MVRTVFGIIIYDNLQLLSPVNFTDNRRRVYSLRNRKHFYEQGYLSAGLFSKQAEGYRDYGAAGWGSKPGDLRDMGSSDPSRDTA
jgi:hypothetical protein